LQNNQGSTDVASLSAAANYWANYLPPSIGRDEEVRQLYDLISSSERRPPNDTTHVVTVLGRPNDIGKDYFVVAKVCSQLLLYGLDTLDDGAESVREFSQSLLSVLRPKSQKIAHPNSCIVVVTTEESVATYWTTEATPVAVYNMKPIAHESSQLRTAGLFTLFVCTYLRNTRSVSKLQLARSSLWIIVCLKSNLFNVL
jgi:hypothetical protein